ncbi:MAG: carnitine dehydratase [Chloroflexi bacterium]|nr:carnitine dehydratase [Chloroflexota bacterium]
MAMALEGIKVVDLTRMAPGPFCTMVLGDMGAEVIKVEQPGGGRMAVARGLPDAAEAQRRAAFSAVNRNKRSIVLNLKNRESQDILLKLAEDADVFLEGFRPGVVSRLGCDYETLHKLNPKLVYCSLSGYGQDGPYQNLVGHDINYISVGGALGGIGTPDGRPAIPNNIIADYAGGGLHAAVGVMGALLAKGTTGEGQYVDIAMSDGVGYMLAAMMSEYFSLGSIPKPGATVLNGAAPYYNVYKCKDGKYLSLGCIEPWFWTDLCTALGREDLIEGQFDESNWLRVTVELENIFAQRDREEWWTMLESAGDVAVAKVYSIDEMVEDPQNVHRKMVIDVGEVNGETVRQVGIGPKLSTTPGSVRTLGAVTGQHTKEILSELGYASADVERLISESAVEAA